MPPLTLDGDTLGLKHQQYNKLVNDAVASKSELTKINYDDSDLDNLLKIDIANKNRNVDYILDVLKCEDLLYVSRALKRGRWLVTEHQHSHIINPQYLHTHLFPHMTTKAINKLILHIKLNLKDEKRVEDFYAYIKEQRGDDALRWLQNCSLDYIENILKSGTSIPSFLFKRLCRRSYKFFKYHSNVNRHRASVLREVLFILNDHSDEYLDYLETLESYNVPNIDKKYTEIIMKKNPNRILNNFEKYATSVDLATVAKHLKKEEIKDFLMKYMHKNSLKHIMTDYEILKHFVKYMPKDERHEFVKKVCIERNPVSELNIGMAMCCSSDAMMKSGFSAAPTNSYRWYQYVPFQVAFSDLKKLIRTESTPSERCCMFAILLSASRQNPQHMHTVLQYYLDKHRNEPFKFKIQFVNNVLSQNTAHKFDDKTWHILDQLFHSMEVYTESDNDVQPCVKAIIIRNVVNGHVVPEIVEKKFIFDTYKNYQSHLSQEQKDKIFNYLLNHITTKLQNAIINSESEFKVKIDLLKNALKLLIDWKKDLNDHSVLFEIIKQLISIRKENSWKTNLSSLYNMNKKWRRNLFPQSLYLCPSETTCLNALKHEPRLLARHGTELFQLNAKDAAAPQLLAKLRIYWPDTLAKTFINDYYERFSENSGHKAVITGLFSLLPLKQAVDVAKKYIPKETQINWTEADAKELSIRKNIAKCLHLTRPQPPVEVVLWYAKGDYLQYAVPSINAVLHNLSKTRSREHIEKLLDAPVSLQKYGIGLAFDKFESDELRLMFLNIWNTTKNSTIRAMLFTNTHKMLCKVKTADDAIDIWILLKTFIENLSNDENKIIYNKLGQVENIHASVKGEYFMESFKFLSSLPAKNNCESMVSNLIDHATLIMNLLEPGFVANILLANIGEKFSTKICTTTNVISSFVLHGNTEEEQLQRFDEVLKPIIERASRSWDAINDDDVYLVKNNLKELTSALSWHFRALTIKKKIPVPVKLFGTIRNKIEETFVTQEKYLLTTYWKLAESYAKLVEEHNSMLAEEKELSDENFSGHWMSYEADKIWQKMHQKISVTLGPIYVRYLKDDVEKYFPSIYLLFGDVLDTVCINLLSNNTSMKLDILMNMLGDNDCIESYILVCERIPVYGGSEDIDKRNKIRKILSSHPSMEVQMHFMKAFRDIPERNNKTEGEIGDRNDVKED